MASKDLLRHELIGAELEVVDASNKSLLGLHGTIVDETKNTLVIERGSKTRRLFKASTTMKIKFKKNTVRVEGRLLVGRPEDRLKKRFTI